MVVYGSTAQVLFDFDDFGFDPAKIVKAINDFSIANAMVERGTLAHTAFEAVGRYLLKPDAGFRSYIRW